MIFNQVSLRAGMGAALAFPLIAGCAATGATVDPTPTSSASVAGWSKPTTFPVPACSPDSISDDGTVVSSTDPGMTTGAAGAAVGRLAEGKWTWTALTKSGDPGDFSQVSADGSTVIWGEMNSSGYPIGNFTSKWNGTSWSDPLPIGSLNAIAVLSDDGNTAVFRGTTSSGGNGIYSTSFDGQKWATPTALYATAVRTTVPVLSSDASTVVWATATTEKPNKDPSIVQAIHRDSSGHWGSIETISAEKGGAYPQVSGDGSTVVWWRDGRTTTSVYAASQIDGAWKVATIPGASQGNGSVLSKSGHVVAFNLNGRIEASVNESGVWQTPSVVTPALSDIGEPVISDDGTAIAYASGSGDDVYVSEQAGQAWGNPTLLDSSGQDGVILAGNGRAVSWAVSVPNGFSGAYSSRS